MSQDNNEEKKISPGLIKSIEEIQRVRSREVADISDGGSSGRSDGHDVR